MKLLHIGDLHLGKSLNDYDLIEDQKYILDRIIDIAKERSVDAFLIAGDVYDKALPSEAATRLLDDFIFRVSEMGIKTFMISGNHDSDDRLNYGSRLFSNKGIYISAVYDGSLSCQTLEDEYGRLNIYMLPFVKASMVRHFHPEETIGNYDDAVKTIIKKAGIDRSARNVILAHQFVIGADRGPSDENMDPVLAGSESAGTLSVGLVEKVGSDCFDDFDYVALGHIHSPQRVGRDMVRYSGSPLKYSLSEADNDKSMPLITFNEKGNVELELIPLKPRRNLRHIKGKLKQLLDKDNITDTDDYIYVTLTDEDFVNDAMGIMRQVYPNTIKIDYHNSHTREVDQVDLSKIMENKPFEELICDFYKQMYGCEISEEELDLMRQLAQETGVSTGDK